MIWLLWQLIKAPFRLVFGTARLGAKTGYWTGRLLGFRRMFVFACGIAVGLMIAPMSGERLRQKLLERLEELRPDTASVVRDRLSHDPRTWHLPQPEVEVIGSRVVLRGMTPDDSGRADLEAVAAAVDRVTHVDNRIGIAEVD